MAKLKVYEYPHPILKQKAAKVEKVDDELRRFLDDMLETMYAAEGVGLAAPQVGVLRRIAVIDVGEGPYVFVNPKIVETAGEQVGDEGCLSVPGKSGIVRRPEYVKTVAFDADMNPIEVEGHGLFARAMCHEFDHLDGHLYLEKVEGPLNEVSYADEDEN